ncbi:glutamate receptor ionotropic, kainate 2-like [Panulirus ornatus]|uniref:glutamate receptor ionotropic, kainate 2-like n=1 Tax=Panulirus ornatus TaxID=150431 RepID=UPI003A8C6EBA
MDVKFNRHWNLMDGDHQINDLFLEQPEDFMGHTFDILAIHFFPLLDLRRDSEELGTTYTPLDSVDIRMLNSFSAHANFTYKMRESWDGQYGMDQGNGNWTGIVGMLQHHQADIGLDLELTPTRIYVMDYSVLYSQETLAIFSLKPGLLPQHLAIIRPLSEVIWLALLVSLLVWCIMLWLTQKAWSIMTGGQSLEFTSTFLYGWSVLMEEFSSSPTANPSGQCGCHNAWVYLQVLVGLWMLACVILTNTYRSSLVAHLTVQDKMPAINSFQDILARDGWGWGSSFANDASTLFFKHHVNPAMQEIYRGMQYAPAEEQFQRVLKGSYSHITFKNFGLGIVAASMTDNRGYTPIYVGKSEYLQFLGFGFGFRRGAPFRLRISNMMQHLMEGGLIEYWIDDVISIHMRKSRAERRNRDGEDKKDSDMLQVDDRNVSLGLIHLQGVFYLLLLGCGLAFLASLGEKCASYTN